MEFFIPLLIWVACGAITAAIASSRNRSVVGWFFVGLIFGCLPMVILMVLPNPVEEQRKFDRLSKENRRLRETLTKDRMVSDHRDNTTGRRLTAHDRALNLDTAAMGTPEELGDESVQPPSIPGSPTDEAAVASWFYADGNEKIGPLSLRDLQEAWREDELGRRTLVWCTGMDDWRPAADIPELLDALEDDEGV